MNTLTEIIVIDYGLGNLNSVVRAITAAGGKCRISANHADFVHAKKLILPGVGAFAAGMDGLRERKMIEPLIEQVKKGKELLGLCLGMQLLFDKGEEFGTHKGLGLIPGVVKKLHPMTEEAKIPHMGWNALLYPKNKKWKNTILENLKEKDMVYFVHSFAPAPSLPAHCIAETVYGNEYFCSVVSNGNIHGTQFHPEKSGEIGQKILRKFLKS